MKNIILLTILVWLPSCGQQPGASAACPDSATSCETSTTTTNKPQASQPSTTSSPDKEEKKKVYVNSYYLNTKADMPACDMDHDKHLVYIVKEKVFYACDVFSWVQVSIKGDKGDVGDTGAQGSQGAAGQIVNSNMWYDAVTSKYWLLPMAYVSGNTMSEANFCGSNYRVPTYSEIQQANARGLSVAADTVGAIKEAYYGTSYQNYVVRTGGNAAASTSGYYCIQK